MSFYITLPSNASMNMYPNNTVASFTTLLSSPINLEMSYEVGLVAFTYRQAIGYNLGNVTLSEVSESIRTEHDTASIPYVEGETREELIERICSIVRRNLVNSKKYEILKVIVMHAHTNSFGIMLGSNYFLEFSGVLATILGVSENVQYGGKSNGISTQNTLLNQTLISFSSALQNMPIYRNESFYIYCDIVEDQFVGDSKVNLLDTYAIQGRSGETLTIRFPNPHYVNVGKSIINTINISIKNSIGNLIQFADLTETIVKLHFRPKRYE